MWETERRDRTAVHAGLTGSRRSVPSAGLSAPPGLTLDSHADGADATDAADAVELRLAAQRMLATCVEVVGRLSTTRAAAPILCRAF